MSNEILAIFSSEFIKTEFFSYIIASGLTLIPKTVMTIFKDDSVEKQFLDSVLEATYQTQYKYKFEFEEQQFAFSFISHWKDNRDLSGEEAIRKILRESLHLTISQDFLGTWTFFFFRATSNPKRQWLTNFIHTSKVLSIDNTNKADNSYPTIMSKYPITYIEQLIGRDKLIDDLYNLIQFEDLLLISGMPGIGKSEVLIALFNQSLSGISNKTASFKHLIWINYSENIKISIINTLHGLVETVNFNSTWSEISSILLKLGKEVVLFIDNFDGSNIETDILTIKALGVKVCVASRSISFPSFKKKNIPPLSIKNCFSLFRMYYGTMPDTEFVAKIIDLTGRHTLSLTIIAKNGRNQRRKPKQIFEDLKKSNFSIPSKNKDVNMYQSEIRKLLKVYAFTKRQKQILYLFSYLPSQDISDDLASKWFGVDRFESIDTLAMNGWLVIRNSNTQLTTSYSMHSIVASIFRSEYMFDSLREMLILNIFNSMQYTNSKSYIDLLIPLNYALELLSHTKNCSTKEGDLLNDSAMILLHMGDYQTAVQLQKRCLLIYNKKLDVSHPDVATAYDNLGLMYLDAEIFPRAKRCLHKAKNLRKQYNPSDYKMLAYSYNNISTFFNKVGQYETAIKWQRAAIQLKEQEGDQISLARSYHNLAVFLTDYVRSDFNIEMTKRQLLLDEAKCKETDALNIRKDKLDSYNNEIAQSFSSLAIIHATMGNYPLALNNNQEAISIMMKKYPPSHISFANLYHNRAKILFDSGQLKDALEYQKKGIDIRSNVHTTGFTLAKDLMTEAKIYKAMRNERAAIAIAKEAHEALMNYNEKEAQSLRSEIEEFLVTN